MSLSVETDLKKLQGGGREEKKENDEEEYYYEYDDEADNQDEQPRNTDRSPNFLIQENFKPEALSPQQSEKQQSPVREDVMEPDYN
mmetsp:Transcript_8528/g.13143  ORF Transcript_8528/g.13143 Transcript_8528/m.13143 type:complete len:86 (-) Transcript_8528:1679-1936(-)|eukprot:CAMPEP_0170511512 /NCGR_PEP_ID=MMETSP0208-20121228/66347_1 /TAXON_ID=197538 /ORGANISM="Strombidium inclinatum, Strain S3" /LENGTH=85 /DNA_ID=CAMNT_0010795061 /DNA_START=2181 /DNA_END=2438 /DNA_ORIENTATION=+